MSFKKASQQEKQGKLLLKMAKIYAKLVCQ